jgi:hypothetical protein
MGVYKMTLLIDEIEMQFYFYGFIAPPLTRKRIASYLIRGFSIDEIYSLGCDAYCHGKYF